MKAFMTHMILVTVALSLGAAAGYAVARNLKEKIKRSSAIRWCHDRRVVYEALNNIGSNRLKIRIILNDNGMSIAHNVGASVKAFAASGAHYI